MIGKVGEGGSGLCVRLTNFDFILQGVGNLKDLKRAQVCARRAWLLERGSGESRQWRLRRLLQESWQGVLADTEAVASGKGRSGWAQKMLEPFIY